MADETLKSKFQSGVGSEQNKYSDLSQPQLLKVLQEYDAALNRIAGKLADQEMLVAYRERSGTGPTELEHGRLAGYKDVAVIALDVLYGNGGR